MHVVVFGAGSLGSLVGGLLARVHDVTLVARADHARAVAADGLRVEGAVETHVHPAATTGGRDLVADFAVVTVKSFDTLAAAEALATGEYEAALSLQNGMGNEAILADHLDCPILAGTATFGAILQRPGVVECTGRGAVALGPRDGGESAAADRAGAAFERARIETTVAADMPVRRWEKLAINAGINAVTALAGVDNGAVLAAPASDLARDAARETARVARAHGIALSNREALAALSSVAETTARNTSSMRQDVRAGRRTEIDAINGYVVDRAAACGLDAPTNRTLATLVKTWERGRTRR